MKREPLDKSLDLPLVTNKSQAVIENRLTKENVTCAKIGWALKTVESKFFLCSCEGTNALFHEMFPDSKIALSFSLSRTNVLNFALGVIQRGRGGVKTNAYNCVQGERGVQGCLWTQHFFLDHKISKLFFFFAQKKLLHCHLLCIEKV